MARSETEDLCNMDTFFSFTELLDDGNLAAFKGDTHDGEMRKVQNARLREAVEKSTVEMPVPYVQIRNLVNDTEVPAMQLDVKSMVLTCDWRGMFSAFFADQKLYEKKLSEVV